MRAIIRLLALGLALLPLAAEAADRIRPTRPTQLRAVAIEPTRIGLAWNASTDNSGSFVYLVSELTSGQTRSVAQDLPATTWTGLQPGQTYRFTVRARDGAGNESLPSNTLTVGTPLPPVAAPANLRLTAASYSSLSIGWDAVPGTTQYEVSIDGRISPGSAATTYSFHGLRPNATHQLAVRVASPRPGPWSAPITGATWIDTVAPTPPVVSGVALSPGVVDLTWTASTDDVFSGIGYNVYVDGRSYGDIWPDAADGRRVTVLNLRGSTTFRFEVRAYDAAGNLSAGGVPLVLTMPAGSDRTPPAAPGALQVVPNQGNGISSVGLAWTPSADDLRTWAYEVYRDGVPVGETRIDVQYNTLDTHFTVRGLVPGSSHTFTVRARDEAGNLSAPSNGVGVTLAGSSDVTPPPAPVLQWGSTSAGCNFVDFGWLVAADDVDPANALEIEVYEDDVLLGVWRGEVMQASYGLHGYHVRAVDRAGNRSDPSNRLLLESELRC